MKKKVLKVTGIILSLVLVLGLMTGCGSKKTTSDKKEEKKQFKIAKKDLKAGVVLDAIGEYCYRASIELADVARKGNMLPVGLAKGARMKVDVRKDEVITYDMVELNEDSVLLQLRRMQDQLLCGAAMQAQ